MGYAPILRYRDPMSLPDFDRPISFSADVFDFTDTTPYRVFWQNESPAIVGDTIKKTLLEKWSFYNLILCWDADVLAQCPNARYFPQGALWCHEADTSQKEFAVSFLMSGKTGCPGYTFRHECYAAVDEIRNVPIVKHTSPPWLPNKRPMLVPFQYAISMENIQRPNYFAEVLNDCCGTKTIPLYWGCPNIEKFYNTDSFLTFHSVPELLGILKSLKPDYYATKTAALEENYNKVLDRKYEYRTANLVQAVIDSWSKK